jgi:hypothetical protein
VNNLFFILFIYKMSCNEYVQFDKRSLPNYYKKVIHDKKEPPHCQDELKKKGFAWKINGNRTKFLDCLNNSCSKGETETCDYRDQFYLDDASKLKSYTQTKDKIILKKPEFFLTELSERNFKQLLNPNVGYAVDNKIIKYIKDNILYTEDGKCFYPISDAGANERLEINGNTTFGLEKLRGTFWEKMPHKTFLKDNRLNTGLSVNDDAILYNRLPFFIKYGDSYLIPKEKNGGRRVSRKKRSLKKRSHRW